MDTENVKLPKHIFKLPTEAGENLHYLENRNITKEYAAYFNLHFCYAGGTWEYTKEDGDKAWVNFEDRVIIPVVDLEGTLVTFQGRDITGRGGKEVFVPLKTTWHWTFLIQRSQRSGV